MVRYVSADKSVAHTHHSRIFPSRFCLLLLLYLGSWCWCLDRGSSSCWSGKAATRCALAAGRRAHRHAQSRSSSSNLWTFDSRQGNLNEDKTIIKSTYVRLQNTIKKLMFGLSRCLLTRRTLGRQHRGRVDACSAAGRLN